MTGVEHYREAEHLINIARSGEKLRRYVENPTGDMLPVQHSVAAMAQVHATLALAAATAGHWRSGLPS